MAQKTEQEAPTARKSIRSRVLQSDSLGFVVNITPGAFWLITFFLVPLLIMAYYSFGERGAFGEVLLGAEYLGLQQYAIFFVPEGATAGQAIWWTVGWILEGLIPFGIELTSGAPTVYVQVLVKSINFGLITTGFALAVSYPTAYFIVRVIPDRFQQLGLILLLLPYWASYLVRVYALKLLTYENGPIFNVLDALPGMQGVGLVFTDTAVMLGMIYIYVPFAVLPIYANLDDVDFTLREAALVLGATRLTAFRKVILPLTIPGIFAASILVFIPATGTFVIPEILGGGDAAFIGKFIAEQFGGAGNWPLGSAAGFIFTGVVLVVIGLYQRVIGGGDLA
jgi:ABC-type spermidine/putrescine transport system permease subunit I